MLASPLSPFLDTYSLSMSSLRCLVLFFVFNFLVLWSICLISSFIHFKNGPEYLIRDTSKVFIPLMRFQLLSLVSRSFFRSSEVLFSSPPIWWCPFPVFPGTSNFPFFHSFLILSWFGGSITSVICLFPPFSLWPCHIFICRIRFLYPGCIF